MLRSKSGRYLVFVVVIIVIALLWVAARRSQSTKIVSSSGSDEIADSPRASKTNEEPPASNNPTFSNQVIADPAVSRDVQMEMAANEKNVSIDFWGHVMDQDGNALSGVAIKAHPRTWGRFNGVIGAQYSPISVVSDAAGNFQIHNLRGDILTIESLTKDGYEPEPGSLTGYGYNTSDNISVSADNPVIFRMWKTGIKEPLVTGRKFFPIVPDGRSHAIDLLTGKFVDSNESGDLSVSIKRPARIQVGEKYDWSFHVNAIGGGLIENDNAASSMYLAPSDGYTNIYEGNLSGSMRGWTDGIGNRRFYLKGRNGKLYGKIEIEVYAAYGNSGEARIWINYAVNPSGSRVLR